MSNILFIIPNYSTQITGASKRAKYLSKLFSIKYKVFILTSSMIITLKNGKVLSKKKRTIFDIIFLFFNHKFDYWFCDYIKWSFIPIRGLIFTLHDMKEWTEYGRIGTLKKILIFFITRKAKYLITVSEDQRRIIRDKLKINSHVFHNAVSKKWLANHLKKKKINNKNKDEYIIYVSNFTKNKNHLNMIKNNPLFKRYKMVFVGSHIDKHGIKIRKNLLKYDNVKIYSKISETRLMDLIHNSSFAIFPSNYEGFGMPILETITLQKKILISNSLKLQHFKNNPLVRKVDFKKGVKKKDIIWAKSSRKNSVKSYSCFVSWEDTCNKMIKFLNN